MFTNLEWQSPLQLQRRELEEGNTLLVIVITRKDGSVWGRKEYRYTRFRSRSQIWPSDTWGRKEYRYTRFRSRSQIWPSDTWGRKEYRYTRFRSSPEDRGRLGGG